MPQEAPVEEPSGTEGDNADVQIFKAEEDEEEKALREYREKMLALLPAGGANFNTVLNEQEDLDKDFDAFMEEEYDDAKIGEGAEDAEVKD